MISVLLPTYNSGKYIARAIDSVLKQTYTDFELIVVDDGSTDDTLDVLKQYTDPRIVVISFTENKGIVEALNHGLRQCNRKYIARMDADDICLPTRFAEQLRFLESNPDYVACGCSIINFAEDTESYMRYPTTDEEIRVALTFFERNICHPTVMMRRSTLIGHEINYRSNYHYAEDYTLWIDLSKQGKLHNLKKPLLKYQRHGDQISKRYYHQQVETSRTIVNEQLQFTWGDIQQTEVEDIMRLCVHEQGVYPDTNFPLKDVRRTINNVLERNKQEPNFCHSSLRRLLYFKKFRCSFYYIYKSKHLVKVWCLLNYLFLIQPRHGQ
ncbi:glycosyl transferase group 2 family protein [Vibrio astriarenae]|nr:glycosyl transferase group 2 family protein [Vibrio sp. C7]